MFFFYTVCILSQGIHPSWISTITSSKETFWVCQPGYDVSRISEWDEKDGRGTGEARKWDGGIEGEVTDDTITAGGGKRQVRGTDATARTEGTIDGSFSFCLPQPRYLIC